MFRPSLLQLNFNPTKVDLALRLKVMVRKCIFSGCDRNALENSNYCILHENYRSTTYDEDYLNREKAKAFYEEIKSGVRNFKGCIFPEISLTNYELPKYKFYRLRF